MKNQTPEKSIEEIDCKNEMAKLFCSEIMNSPKNKAEKTITKYLVKAFEYGEKKTKETERQKREEVVEALKDIASVTPDDAERWGWYETVNKIVGRASEALTQPNNPK